MKFQDLPLGSIFRLTGKGLPPRLALKESLGPFRKVAEDGAAELADDRSAKIYIPPMVNVHVVPLPPSG